MKNSKQLVSLILAAAIATTLFAGKASARPSLDGATPAQSVELCIAQVSAQANYDGAGRVLHNVSTKKRRISGHTIVIDTTVFDSGSNAIIREYTSRCVVTDSRQTTKFDILEKVEQ